MLFILNIIALNAQESLNYGRGLLYRVLIETLSFSIKGPCVCTYGKHSFLDKHNQHECNRYFSAKAIAQMYAKSMPKVIYKYSWY